VSGFASSILSSKDHPSLVIGALQLVELLLAKSPAMYKPAFRREGVFYEIESLAAREVLSKKDRSDREATSDGSSETSHTAPVLSGWSIPGFKKLTSLSLEPEDAITFRARAIRLKYLAPEERDDANATFQTLQQIVDCISKEHTSEKALVGALDELSQLFESPQSSVSSFELLQSGVIDGLLGLTTDYERSGKRIEILYIT
jgi:E3 ubiquitin-protein ligase TRIP12